MNTWLYWAHSGKRCGVWDFSFRGDTRTHSPRSFYTREHEWSFYQSQSIDRLGVDPNRVWVCCVRDESSTCNDGVGRNVRAYLSWSDHPSAHGLDDYRGIVWGPWRTRNTRVRNRSMPYTHDGPGRRIRKCGEGDRRIEILCAPWSFIKRTRFLPCQFCWTLSGQIFRLISWFSDSFLGSLVYVIQRYRMHSAQCTVTMHCIKSFQILIQMTPDNVLKTSW